MYPLYCIEMPPIPLKCSTPITKFLSERILNSISVQNPSVKADFWDPVSTSAVISTPSITTKAFIGMTK